MSVGTSISIRAGVQARCRVRLRLRELQASRAGFLLASC